MIDTIKLAFKRGFNNPQTCKHHLDITNRCKKCGFTLDEFTELDLNPA